MQVPDLTGEDTLLVQHRVRQLIYGWKLALVPRMSKAKAYLLASVPIQAQQALFCRPKFRQYADFPSSLSHDRLDERGYFAKKM